MNIEYLPISGFFGVFKESDYDDDGGVLRVKGFKYPKNKYK